MTDLFYGKIYNSCITAGILLSFIPLMISRPSHISYASLPHSFLYLLPYLFLFMLHMIGAGDVKLFFLLTFYLSPTMLLQSMAVSMVLSAVAALFKMIREKILLEHLCYFLKYIHSCFITHSLLVYAEPESCVTVSGSKSRIPLAPFVLSAVLILYGRNYL